MSDWIKIGVEFIKALPGQWKGSSDPNAPSEIVDTMAEGAPRADSVAVGDESQISIKTGASPNRHEIARRREIVRQFFNDFWGVRRGQAGDIRGVPKSGRTPHQRTTGCAWRDMAA